jgi:hypothetical protein
MTIKKRGRPAGSKNKKPTPAQMHKAAAKIAKSNNPISDFQKTLIAWDRMEAETSVVDFKELCQKLQEALAKSYIEAEELERQIAYWRNETGARDIIIRYLESRKS